MIMRIVMRATLFPTQLKGPIYCGSAVLAESPDEKMYFYI